MIGASVGFFIATVGITIAGTFGGIGFGASLRLGTFVGTFDGAGFGSMMGATILARQRRRPARTIDPPRTRRTA